MRPRSRTAAPRPHAPVYDQFRHDQQRHRQQKPDVHLDIVEERHRRCQPTRALPQPTVPAAAPRPAPSTRRSGGAATAAHLRPDESAARSDTAARQAPKRSQPGRSRFARSYNRSFVLAVEAVSPRPRVVVADGNRGEIGADRGVGATAHRHPNRLAAIHRARKRGADARVALEIEVLRAADRRLSAREVVGVARQPHACA